MQCRGSRSGAAASVAVRGHGDYGRWCEVAQDAARDRLFIGDVRGAEAFDLLQALNTGHAGSLSTIHAHSRVTNRVLQADGGLPSRAIWAFIAESGGPGRAPQA